MSDNDKSRKAANEQLMPCPFCGGKARVNDHIYFDIPPSYGIVCEECGAMSKQFYDTMGEAVDAWNTRKEMTAREYITIEQRCKSWCVSNCANDGGCESCCYHGSCWADTFQPDAYLWFYTLWAKDHPEEYDFCLHCGADMQLTASNEKKCKTYLEDFFEKFPSAKKDGRGLPLMCRSSVYGGSCHFGTAERADCAACWNAEMEDADE